MNSSRVFSGVRAARSLVFCVMYCKRLFVLFLLVIVLSLLLRFTDSEYPLVSSYYFLFFFREYIQQHLYRLEGTKLQPNLLFTHSLGKQFLELLPLELTTNKKDLLLSQLIVSMTISDHSIHQLPHQGNSLPRNNDGILIQWNCVSGRIY